MIFHPMKYYQNQNLIFQLLVIYIGIVFVIFVSIVFVTFVNTLSVAFIITDKFSTVSNTFQVLANVTNACASIPTTIIFAHGIIFSLALACIVILLLI